MTVFRFSRRSGSLRPTEGKCLKNSLRMLALTGVAVLAGCSTVSEDSGSGTELAGMMQCGQLDVTADYQDDGLLLTIGDDSLQMVQTESASGAKYQLPDDPETSFWTKGESAMLTVNGQSWPECVTAGAITDPLVARGNEPFWRLTVEGGKLILDEMGSQQSVVSDFSVAAAGPAGRTLTSENGARSMTVAVAPQLCRDTMTGMPYPYQVRLTVDGESRRGCGGESSRLLQGVEWVVEDIDGGGIVDGSRVTINFLADGRVGGKASCNNFMSGYELTGEGLAFGQTATTMMACVPALMQQERRFLDALEAVRRFDFNQDGALVLQGDDGHSLRAYGSQSLRP